MPESIEEVRKRLEEKRAERERLTEQREEEQTKREEQISIDRALKEEARLDADIAYEKAAAEVLAQAAAKREGITPPDNTAVESTPSVPQSVFAVPNAKRDEDDEDRDEEKE